MNVKKRPRLELTTAATATDVALLSSSFGSGNGNSGNGLFLTSSMGVGGVEMNNGAQIYLTICDDDDNSNESQEFYAIESIKQEPDLDALHALLPSNLQLPTGCEIYLVKDTTATTIVPSVAASTRTNEQFLPKYPQSVASIKLEPDSIATPSTNVLFVSGNGAASSHNIVVATSKESPSSSSSLVFNAHASNPAANPSVVPAVAPTAVNAHCTGYNVKMDAYKKRDDKRRATHNEVERRRRDKINCWIFKLKEMLPTEGNRYKPSNDNVEPLDSKTTVRSHNNGRTPPNDSKSQILIKACDYIKSMQDEIDTLRDCLREADSLRLSNQALRDELENLKQQQELQERFNTAGGSFNVTLNSLNSSATSDLFDGIDTAPNLSTVSSINFTKRGLMIADYDE